MVNYRKIAISGKSRSGKNTAAEIITSKLEKQGYVVKTFAFADPIKEMICTMIPHADRNALWGPSENREWIISGYKDSEGNPLTYRQACLDIGKLGRIYNRDCWINVLMFVIESFVKEDAKHIGLLCDGRFVNELAAIKNNEFYAIRIIRPLKRKEVQDISEIDLDDTPDSEFNSAINNDTTLEDFTAKIEKLTENIMLQS